MTMADRFQIGELVRCGDFVGVLGGREECRDGTILLFLTKSSYVSDGIDRACVDDWRLAVERLCEKAHAN
jgi:hypothetical protein